MRDQGGNGVHESVGPLNWYRRWSGVRLPGIRLGGGRMHGGHHVIGGTILKQDRVPGSSPLPRPKPASNADQAHEISFAPPSPPPRHPPNPQPCLQSSLWRQWYVTNGWGVRSTNLAKRVGRSITIGWILRISNVAAWRSSQTSCA